MNNNIIPVVGLCDKKTNYVFNYLTELCRFKEGDNWKAPQWDKLYLFVKKISNTRGEVYLDVDCRIKFYCLSGWKDNEIKLSHNVVQAGYYFVFI